MTISNLLFKDLIKDLKKEQTKIGRKIKILQSWIGEKTEKKRSLASTRAHSIRMKKVWAAKKREAKKG